jgi:hypothetical protein
MPSSCDSWVPRDLRTVVSIRIGIGRDQAGERATSPGVACCNRGSIAGFAMCVARAGGVVIRKKHMVGIFW